MKKEFRLAVAILLFFVLLAAGHLFIVTKNIGLKYQITDTKVKLAELRSQNRIFGTQIAAKESLGLVEKIAKGKLGMIYPVKVNYIAAPRP